jgi:DNA-binding Xre family transcriptional regulator
MNTKSLSTTKSNVKNPHLGSYFDDFLAEQGMLETATATAVKRVIAWQIEEEMKSLQFTKTVLAKKMHTSRAALNRLLDSEDTSLTLTTLASAAAALGKQIKFELVSI